MAEMEDEFEDLLSSCSATHFGIVDISQEEKEFYHDLNNHIVSLCKSLPKSAQTKALLFLIDYSKIPFDKDLKDLDFFKHYYVPTWSILYWLTHRCQDAGRLRQLDIRNTKTAHAMAMLLHSLDDHLNDHELPASHVVLLLRSQSWMIMNQALAALANKADGGGEIVQSFINDYYSGICDSAEANSLQEYCDLFRKLMAMGLIVPALMTRGIVSDMEFTDAILTAYISFGIAWRLLDDIQDLRKDMAKGIHSSIYACLPEEIKHSWNADAEKKKDKNNRYIVLSHIRKNSVIDRITERICSELESAASIADRFEMSDWGDEFRSLLKPLRNGRTICERKQ